MTVASGSLIGVSVVICTHNGRSRLDPTLAHLAAQQVPDGLPWEVIVVDNASTDGTGAYVQNIWPANAPVRIRVVNEPEAGLSHARRRGFEEARYEFVSFIDDDNWVSPEWVALVAEILTTHPEVGACGGLNEGAYESTPPTWFSKYEGFLAIGPQGDVAGDVTESRGMLWGAGMSIRKSAWTGLLKADFRFLMGDRVGSSLLAGGDCELCFGLRLSGWRLWYDPRLRLKHFMPAERLQWGYLRRLGRAFGRTDVWADGYRELLTGEKRGRFARLLQPCLIIARHPFKFVFSRFFPFEGDSHITVQELMIGRVLESIRDPRALKAAHEELLRAKWIRRPTKP